MRLYNFPKVFYLDSVSQAWCKNETSNIAVRGSDYSAAIALSEEKDKLVPENWRERKMF